MFPRPPAPPADPASVALVVRCFLLQVVSVEELREWAEHALAGGECPIFVEGLAEFDGEGDAVYRQLGFVPERRFTPQQEAALAGLAHRRGRQPAPETGGEAAARSALEQQPELEEEFRRVFPFLPWGPLAEAQRG